LAGYEAVHGRIVIEHGIIPPPTDQPPKDATGGIPQPTIDKVWAIIRKAYDDFIKENPEAAPLKTGTTK
jgi:hypothetical protein